MISSHISLQRFALALLVLPVLFEAGCISELLDAAPPAIVRPAGDPLDSKTGARLPGIYAVHDGSDIFGDTLIGMWRDGEFCIYAGTQVIFSENVGAIQDSTVQFDGNYRFIRSNRTGSIRLSIAASEGGRALRNGEPSPAIIMRGTYQHPLTGSMQSIVLERARDLEPDSFYIIGHRAGGRNSERLGHSENSIEMARFSELLGCNAIEIDVQPTSDDSMIIFHDEQFSPRTVETTYILGNVSDFTFRQIRRNCRLIHGEQIPTLEEILTFVVDSTQLRLVWLDPKTTHAIDRVIAAMIHARHRAEAAHRNFRVILGLPNSGMRDAYQASSLRDSIEVLVEYAPDVALAIAHCVAYAPRWTLGCDAASVATVQASGRMVFPWTLDSPEYVTQFLGCTRYDGIVSDYPSMLAELVYQHGVKR